MKVKYTVQHETLYLGSSLIKIDFGSYHLGHHCSEPMENLLENPGNRVVRK